MAEISIDDFMAVDVRVGTVVQAEMHLEARSPAIKMWVNFGGELGVKKTSAQIAVHYSANSLVGKQVMAVVNFPTRQIGKFVSEVLVLGFPDVNGAIVLATPDKPVPQGGRLH